MRYSTLLKVVEAILFLIAGICFVYFLNFLVQDIISDIHFLPRYFPFYLVMILPVYYLFVLHHLRYPTSLKMKKLTYVVNGIITFCMASAAFIGVLVLVGNHIYPSMKFGGVTRIYPLDTFIGSILCLIISAFLVVRGFLYSEEEEYYLLAKKKSNRVIKRIFRSIYIFIVLYFAGNVCLIPTTFDTRMTYFACDLAVYILMIVPIVHIIFYEFVYKPKEEGALKEMSIARLSYIGLGLSSVGIIWFLIAKFISPNFISDSLIAIFPFDYLSSIGFGPILLIVINVVPPIVAIFHFLHPEKDKKIKEEEAKEPLEEEKN